MLSLLRVATAPFTLKLSHAPQTPSSPFGKRATFAAVLDDASDSPAGNRLPRVAICHFKGIDALTADIQRLSLLTRPTPIRDIESDAGNNSIAHLNTSPNPTASVAPATYPCSIFPVYGPFDLLYCIQTGGFGSAWAARDRSTDRLLCLKVFQPLKDPNVWRSAKEELRTFRRMVKSEMGESGKQFIIELNRSFLHDTGIFFAMELMTTDLGSYFSIEPERCKLHACRWMAQIALGIESLHEMGIIHRDMKTENILIDSRENIRIIDFGLAYLRSKSKPNHQGPTEFLGTPPYMAPEVLQNQGLPTDLRSPYGTAVDWWALGCILFELESRNHEVLFDTEEDVCTYVVWSQFEQLYPRFEGLDFILVDLLEGLLAVQPSTRYSLTDLEKHDYFLRRDGTTEFHNAAARALQRPIRPELVPQFAGDRGPTKVVGPPQPGTAYDWSNLKWALQVDG